MNKNDYVHLLKEACGGKCNVEYNPCVFRQAADELAALEPVAYMNSKGVLWNKTTHPHLHTALYALDEVKND